MTLSFYEKTSYLWIFDTYLTFAKVKNLYLCTIHFEQMCLCICGMGT